MHEIPGVGAKTVEKLLRTLGSLERVRQASKEELAQVVGAAAANRLQAYFAGDATRNPLVQIAPAVETENEYVG
jgi:excinuclease ABC subunit C